MTQEDVISKLETDVVLLKKQRLQLQFDMDELKEKFEEWEIKKRRKEIEEL